MSQASTRGWSAAWKNGVDLVTAALRAGVRHVADAHGIPETLSMNSEASLPFRTSLQVAAAKPALERR
jgi:hypothetical protein